MRISDWSSDVCSSDLVTAGIDFALALIAQMAGEAAAKAIQLGIEYDPAPPFNSGSPEGAGPEVVEHLRPAMALMLDQRDRKSVVEGKRVSVRVNLGGRSIITKKKN